MGGLDDYKAVSSVEIGKRPAAVQGREIVRVAMAMREKYERQIAPGRRYGDFYPQIDNSQISARPGADNTTGLNERTGVGALTGMFALLAINA